VQLTQDLDDTPGQRFHRSPLGAGILNIVSATSAVAHGIRGTAASGLVAELGAPVVTLVGWHGFFVDPIRQGCDGYQGTTVSIRPVVAKYYCDVCKTIFL